MRRRRSIRSRSEGIAALALALVTALSLAGSRPARAADPEAGSPKATAEARALFRQAEELYNLGKFEEARQDYEAAYERLPLAGFLFNIGQCHRNLKHHAQALFFYKRYLAEKPDAPNRERVDRLVAEMVREVEAERRRDEESARKARLEREAADRQAREAAQQRDEARRERSRRSRARPDLIATDGERDGPAPRPLYARWWFWTGVGATTAVAIAVGVLALGSGDALPASDLGNIDISR